MLPDLWPAPTDAPPTRSLEIALRFPQHPQPKRKLSLTDLNATEEPQILCPPLEVAGFQTFFTGRVWTFGDSPSPTRQCSPSPRGGRVKGAPAAQDRRGAAKRAKPLEAPEHGITMTTRRRGVPPTTDSHDCQLRRRREDRTVVVVRGPSFVGQQPRRARAVLPVLGTLHGA